MRAKHSRHHARTEGVALTAADRRLLSEVFDDAIGARAARLYPCVACQLAPDLVCGVHAQELAAIDCYRSLAARLGVAAP